jgi:hypothetical protein
VTATAWSNFFGLRISPHAQPEIREVAECMQDALARSVPTPTPYGAWHTPLVPDAERLHWDGFEPDQVARISAARCARVSYLTHDGSRDPHADIELADRLMRDGHLSPFEHVATPARPDHDGDLGNFTGWIQLRKTIPFEADFSAQDALDRA